MEGVHTMSKKFDTRSAKDILSTVMPASEMIIQDLMPTGICILAGPQKIGKSYLALDIGVSVALGRPVLDRETLQRECLYLALEDNYRRIQDRLFQMNVEETDLIHFAIIADKLGGGLEKQIEVFTIEHPNLGLVIIDVMQLVRQKTVSNYSSEYNELAELRKLADRLGISILMVMHTKKSRDRDQLNNIYGGGGFVASADAIYVLDQERRGDENCILLCTGREIENVEITLHLDSESMRWLVVNDPATKNSKKSQLLAAVYVYIRDKKHFEGSATKLIEELKSVCSYKFYVNRVTRDLSEEEHKLADNGIFFSTSRDHNGRIIVLHYYENGTHDVPAVTKKTFNRPKLAI